MDPDVKVALDIEKAEQLSPPKYIRTYAGDMATVQRGGISDLVPFVEAPILAVPPPYVPPTSVIVPPPPPLPPPPPIVEARAEISPLHTYGDDFSARVTNPDVSVASILAAEADAERPVSAPSPARTSVVSRWKPILAGVLVIVGIAGLYVAYTKYVARTSPIVIFPAAPAPIFVDERETVSGTGSSLMLAFSQIIGRPLPDGQMRLIYDPNATTSNASIFNELKLPVQDILLRNIDAAGSMAGVVDIAGVQSPFFILSVTSYGDTFASMLTWEPAMLRNLSPLFPPYAQGFGGQAATTVATTTATTTISAPALTNIIAPPPRDQGFIDEVVANHDTRVYRDGAGRSVLMYGYWNQRTLVIARDEAAFTAILGRLATFRTR